MADQLIFDLSSSTPMDGEPFSRRDMLYVNDQNGSSGYGGNQVIIDTASLSNSGRWCNYSEAFITVPLTIVLSADALTGNIDDSVGADFICGLKNGHYQLINSISVEMNNTSIIQQTNLSNAHISYRLNSTMSETDVKLHGATIGYFPDSSSSWDYETGTRGSTNNSIDSTFNPVTTQYVGTNYNLGGYDRQLINGFGISGTNGASALINSSSLQQYNKTRAFPKTGSAGVTQISKVWWINAVIRLKDLHPFFSPETLPLLKGSYFKFYLNLNQSITKFTVSTLSGADYYNVTSVNVFGGGSNPLMLYKTGTSPLTDGQAYTVSVSVKTPIESTQTGLTNAVCQFDSSCKLWVPSYVMNPAKESQYLELHRRKTVKYQDLYSYQFKNQSGNFSILVTNGISRLTSVLVMGQLSADPAGTAGAQYIPSQSPLASEPATCSPLSLITEFNCQISGVNSFQDNQKYGYIQFLTELVGQGTNGGITTGLSSGQISKEDFEQMYGYLLVDAKRRLGPAFVAPASVQLTGTVQCLKPLDLFTFLTFERELTIDTFTGDIVSA